MMAEVIELSDSSDDEGRKVAFNDTSSTVRQSNHSQVISLIESDDDEEVVVCNTKIPSSAASSPTARKQNVRSKLQSSSIANIYASLASDSDDDSLDRYQASGLSKGARKRKRNNLDSDDSNCIQIFSPHATATINKVTPVQPSNGTETTARIISQEMDQTINSEVPSSSSDERTTLSTTRRLPQHSMESRRNITNPYARKNKKSSPTAVSTTRKVHTQDPIRMIANPYTRKATPTIPSEALSAMMPSTEDLFPSQLTRRGKTYPDLRAKLALCLWRYARSLAHCSYQRTRFTHTIQKLVAISCLAEYPIRSLQEYILRFQAQSIDAVSVMNQKVNDLTEQLSKGGWEAVSTTVHANATGQYYSIAEACLVVCQKRLQPLLKDGNGTNLEEQLKQKEHYLPLALILPEIDRHLRPECPSQIARPQEDDQGVQFYESSSTISAEFHQIKRLSSLSCIKFHKRKGRTLIELLPKGFQMAERLISRVYPSPNGWYRRSHKDYPTAPAYPASVTDCTTPSSYSNIVLCMDFREGGGASRVLHQMCNNLDAIRLPYFVASLSIGDYVFFHKDKLLPVLIERKSVEDLAQSIYDGRWQSQKKRMYQGQYIFGYEKAILLYIVEGKQEHHLVTGGFVGSTRFRISLERLNEEITMLSQDGFEVLRTASPSSTMHELSKWARKIDQQVQNKVLVPMYTYEEFKQQVAKIPAEVDFSRIAKDHYRQRKERELAQETIVLDSDDDDDDAEVNDPKLPKYNSELHVSTSPRRVATKAASKRSSVQRAATPVAPRTTVASIAAGIKLRLSGGFPKVEHPDYSKWTRDALVKECLQFGLTKSGSRKDLIERLQGPRPPTLWIQRKTEGHWVPARPDSSGTALMVALLLLHQEFPSEREGFRKADICKKADALNISREPFVGTKKSFGQFYDGWSSCAYCKKDPPLVEKGKNHKFRLTREGPYAGYPLAEQLHEWCHVHNTCSCKDL